MEDMSDAPSTTLPETLQDRINADRSALRALLPRVKPADPGEARVRAIVAEAVGGSGAGRIAVAVDALLDIIAEERLEAANDMADELRYEQDRQAD